MAYVIGSQKGKDIAKGMKTNESWTNPTDGSTWTKKADGSVSVTTSKGEKFDNAYTPTSSGGSSGGGGGNSQYTQNNQYTQGNYAINSDYGKQQAQNMGVGTSWIATDGSKWVKENDGTITVYHGNTKTNNAWKPSDLGIAGTQMVQAGVPYQYVENMMNDRVSKALSDDALRQYAYDDTYWMMYNYVQDQKRQGIQDQYNQWPENYEQENERPTQPERDPRIDALLNEILNRDDFSYDAMNDPLYQQYAQMYQREGDRAMKETMAEAAAGAGGMNTYAITAAQQANSYYNSQLNDKIPELYQLAYEMYLNDKESKVQDLGILQNMDATQYNRYRDTLNDWYNDKNFAYGVYQDAIQQGNWQSERDYNAMWDNIRFNNDNYWANLDWNARQSETEYNRNQDDRETAEARMLEIVKGGEMPRDELIAQAGWEKADVEQLVAIKKKTYF